MERILFIEPYNEGDCDRNQTMLSGLSIKMWTLYLLLDHSYCKYEYKYSLEFNLNHPDVLIVIDHAI